jgi:hypothetical protein
MKGGTWVVAAASLAVIVLAALAANELAWRHSHPLALQPAGAPDEAYVAETRKLPDSALLAPQSTGVYVRGRWAWLRSVRPQLVFAGACDHVDTRWMARRRLVIECELRAGEPRLLQALVDDVVIELVVQGRFALGPMSE